MTQSGNNKKMISRKHSFKERIDRVMKDFMVSPEVVDKIISLNDRLYDRFRMAYEDMLKIKEIIDEDILSGRLKVSGYTITPDYFFAYDHENGIPTASAQMLMELSDETTILMPSLTLSQDNISLPDFDTNFLGEDQKLNWNIENLDLPGLENHHIYMFMHHIFQDAGAFCIADIPYLKPEDLQWQIIVEYEFFNK